jgi:hypothetical protein
MNPMNAIRNRRLPEERTIRIRLGLGRYSAPVQAVPSNAGRSWTVVSDDPIWRGAVLGREDVVFESDP